MKKKLFIITVFCLLLLPSLCLAEKDANQTLEKLQVPYNSAFAKSSATSYVLALKTAFADNQSDANFIYAQYQYQIAAAKFTAFKSVLELNLLTKKELPDFNDPLIKEAGRDAYEAYQTFESTAKTALQISGSPDEKSAILPLAATTLASTLTVPNFVSLITELDTIYTKYKDAQEAKTLKLDAWITTYYTWPDWYSIGKENTVKDSTSAQNQISPKTTTITTKSEETKKASVVTQ